MSTMDSERIARVETHLEMQRTLITEIRDEIRSFHDEATAIREIIASHSGALSFGKWLVSALGVLGVLLGAVHEWVSIKAVH